METKPRLNYPYIFILGFGFLTVSILWSVYNTYVPVFLKSRFALGAASIGFIMTLDNIAGLYIHPLIGVVSDRTRTPIGRRMPYLVVGAPIAALAFAFIPDARTFAGFIAAIVVMLLFAAIYRTPGVALMADIVPSPLRSQANGVLSFMGGVGGVLAYFGGGLLYDINPGLPFWVGAIITVLAVPLVVAYIREPREYIEVSGDIEKLTDMMPSVFVLVLSALVWGIGNWWWTGVRAMLVKVVAYFFMAFGFGLFIFTRVRRLPSGNRASMVRLLVAIFCSFMGFSVIEAFFSLYGVRVLLVKENVAGMMLGVATLTFTIFAVPSGLIGARIGRRATVLLGLAIFSALLVVAFFIPHRILICVMLGLGGMAWALININSLPMVLDTAPQGQAGTATGLYYLFSTLGAVAGPITSGLIIQQARENYNLIMLIAPFFFVVAFLPMLGVRHGEASVEAVPAVRAPRLVGD